MRVQYPIKSSISRLKHSIATVNERNAVKRLILKGIEVVIGFLMHNSG